jgi:hypothetical protein
MSIRRWSVVTFSSAGYHHLDKKYFWFRKNARAHRDSLNYLKESHVSSAYRSQHESYHYYVRREW